MLSSNGQQLIVCVLFPPRLWHIMQTFFQRFNRLRKSSCHILPSYDYSNRRWSGCISSLTLHIHPLSSSFAPSILPTPMTAYRNILRVIQKSSPDPTTYIPPSEFSFVVSLQTLPPVCFLHGVFSATTHSVPHCWLIAAFTPCWHNILWPNTNFVLDRVWSFAVLCTCLIRSTNTLNPHRPPSTTLNTTFLSLLLLSNRKLYQP